MSAASSLSDMHREVLKEVGNIGAGHAATSLAQIMNLKVGLTEPLVSTLPITSRALHSDEGARDVAVLEMDVLGDAPGEMVIIFDLQEARDFVTRFLQQQIGDVELDDALIDSSLREIANIIGGSYLTALVGLIGINLVPSTPRLIYGHLHEVLARVTGTGDDHKEAFLINNGFINERGAINVQFLLIPEGGKLTPYLHAFGLE